MAKIACRCELPVTDVQFSTQSESTAMSTGCVHWKCYHISTGFNALGLSRGVEQLHLFGANFRPAVSVNYSSADQSTSESRKGIVL